MTRTLITSGSPYETSVGFSRAVRSGPWLSVAGTAPIAAGGGTACPGDVYGQTRRCLEIIRAAVEEAGFAMADVVRTRLLLKDVSTWEEAGRAHGEVFGDIRPACTVMQASFIDPAWLVELEADCHREG